MKEAVPTPVQPTEQNGQPGFQWSGQFLDELDAISFDELRQGCVKALSDVGAPEEYCMFFAEVLQIENDMNAAIHRLHQNLNRDRAGPYDPARLLSCIQDLTKNFHLWKSTVDTLEETGQQIPALQITKEKLELSTALKALCSIQTNDVHVKEGDEIIITDTSQPNQLKVRNSRGEEGYVPALSCVLPTPDRNALTAVERLRIQMIAFWTECVKKMKKYIMESLNMNSKQLANDWTKNLTSGVAMNRDRVGRRFKRLLNTVEKQKSHLDLTKMHTVLFSLERELTTWNVNGRDVTIMIDTVANLDKSVLCLQMFMKQWHLCKKSLESAERPIRVVDKWEKMRPIAYGKHFRYFEVKMTLEEVETVEEVVCERTPRIKESWSTETGHTHQSVEAEQITSTTREEKQRFIICAVVDPRNNREISFQEALQLGIVNHAKGCYVNIDTGYAIPIPEAMNKGLIKVEQTQTSRGREETSAVGLITIKTKIDNRAYAIQKVIDANNGEKLDALEARSRGILDDVNGTFVITSTGEKISLDEAVQTGWVTVVYENETEAAQYETKTFAVSAVVDQRQKRKVPFYDAVRLGLIEKHTGNYVNNVTGERIYVTEAIQRGFLKAKQVDNSAGLNVNAENNMVVEKLDVIRKNVLKPMAALSALRSSTKHV